MSFKCGNCGTPLYNQQPFCAQCGKPADWGIATSPSSSTLYNCGNCGAQLQNLHPFCGQCGRAINWSAPVPSQAGVSSLPASIPLQQPQSIDNNLHRRLTDDEVDEIMYGHTLIANTYLQDISGTFGSNLAIKRSGALGGFVFEILGITNEEEIEEKMKENDELLYERVKARAPLPKKEIVKHEESIVPFHFETGYEKIIYYYGIAEARRNMIVSGPMKGKLQNYIPRFDEDTYVSFSWNLLPGMGEFVKRLHPAAYQKVLKAMGYLMLR